jgi:hypothetical protein
VSRSEADKHRKGTRLRFGAAGSASFGATTWNESTVDESGKTEVYGGAYDQSVVSNIPLMKGHDNTSLQMISTEVNDSERSYVLQGFVDSSRGEDSREHLAEITGTDIGPDTGHGVDSSGKWRVDVRITEEHVEDVIDRISHQKYANMGIFAGEDAKNELRKALQQATSSDEQMKALAEYVAEDGYDGEAMRSLRVAAFGGDNAIGSMGAAAGNFDYDLHLDGDPNFRGAAGRVELENKIARFQSLMTESPGGAAPLLDSIAAQVTELRQMKSEISDPERYTDLPAELRQMQVGKLDGYIHTLLGMRSQAAIEATKLQPGQVVTDDTWAEKEEELVEADGDPTFIALQQMRNEISLLDAQAAASRSECERLEGEGDALLDAASGGRGSISGSRRDSIYAAESCRRSASEKREGAEALAQAMDEYRLMFVQSFSDPDTALAVGRSVEANQETVSNSLSGAEHAFRQFYDHAVAAAAET